MLCQNYLTQIPPNLSPDLIKYIEKNWQAYTEAAQQANVSIPAATEFNNSVIKVFAVSDFVSEHCRRDPKLLLDLFESGDIFRDYHTYEYIKELEQLSVNLKSENELGVLLRKFRTRETIRIIWRDLANWTSLKTILHELSALADACIQVANKKLYQWQLAEMGAPETYLENSQELIIIAVGKLGGQELNLSSDVDLIFAYPAAGEIKTAEGSITHEQFFIRLSQRLIRILNEITAEGYVFRVDMRLRPFGKSGPMAMNFAALENYYREQGRDWERYALVKARILNQSSPITDELNKIIKKFVYRQYLDYSALEALREMHALITREASIKQLQDHIKLGPGGIREIEFIAQTFQLIGGGENPKLQERQLLNILPLLKSLDLLTSDAVEELREAYIFLRNVEHRLQAVADRQTHQLPPGNFQQLQLAFSMNFTEWQTFLTALNQHRQNVTKHFSQLIAKPQFAVLTNQSIDLQRGIELVWLGQVDSHYAKTILEAIGFHNAQEILLILRSLQESENYQGLNKLNQKRFNDLMPILLITIGQTDKPLQTLKRVTNIIEAIATESAYLPLLLENPKALTQLVGLCSISPWITNLLAAHPALLGELIDPQRLYAPLNFARLEKILTEQLEEIHEDNPSQQMHILRRFKLSNLLRVAAMDITGVLPLMRVSDHLTNIAVTILQQVQRLAWEHLIAIHGYPHRTTTKPHFAIIAYGKLGGIELGYGSDLDLVFLYDDPDHKNHEYTDQEDINNCGLFYTRLAQHMLAMLSTRTAAGALYDIDLRLRPMGESGLLVNSVSAFMEYQRHQAWTWEHQALVRARAISGCEEIINRFAEIREQVLAQPRDEKKLQQEVREMRQRMRQAAKVPPAGFFDLKQGLGGITDIEFITQYCVLCWAHNYPALLEFPDNIRILEKLAEQKLLTLADVRLLSDAYRAYRDLVHRLDLENEPSYVLATQLGQYRQGVQRIWQQLLENNANE